jgi:putative pyruvate formate lyase activating enzyme
MHCCYCNIYRFSQDNKGYSITPNQLIEILFYFQERNCNNVNLCNIVNDLDEIINVLNLAKQKGFNLPVIYNSNGYDDINILHKIAGLVDVYLVDFKYSNNVIGKKYSSVENYLDVFSTAIKEMYSQTGMIQIDNGILKKGTIIRHLIIPSNIENSIEVINIIAQMDFSNNILVSILDQYIPEYKAPQYKGIDRRLNRNETEIVINYAMARKIKLINN